MSSYTEGCHAGQSADWGIQGYESTAGLQVQAWREGCLCSARGIWLGGCRWSTCSHGLNRGMPRGWTDTRQVYRLMPPVMRMSARPTLGRASAGTWCTSSAPPRLPLRLVRCTPSARVSPVTCGLLPKDLPGMNPARPSSASSLALRRCWSPSRASRNPPGGSELAVEGSCGR